MATTLDLLRERTGIKPGVPSGPFQEVETPAAKPAPKIFTKKEKALKIAQVERLKLRRRLLKDFAHFFRYFWDVLEPDVPLVWGWADDAMADTMASAPPNSKTVFNVPPGTGKSLKVVMFRAWRWANNPAYRFFSASYGAHLSIRDNVKLRALVQSEKYQTMFPRVQISGDQNAKEKFETTSGGWSIATSVGGMGTGEHPDYKFIDDPISEQQSRSKTERDSANMWIDRTLSMRGLTRNCITFLVMQRLHMDDPTGHVLKQGGWELLRFPMRYEKCTCRPSTMDEMLGETCPLHKADPYWVPDPRDIRQEPGELLMPDLFTPEKVAIAELPLGPFGVAGQMQQRPSPEGGGLFKREWFQIVDALPAVHRSKVRRARGWDTAGTEQGGDWTVGVRIMQVEISPEVHTRGANGEPVITPATYHYYVEHVVRAQTANVDALIRATAEMDGKKVDVREEKEGGASGVAVVKTRANALRGFSYEAVQVSGDKITRAKPFRTQCQAGNVFLLRGEWNHAYLDELTHFPVGEHDDQVDGSSCTFNALAAEKPRQNRATWGSSGRRAPHLRLAS